MANRRKLSEEEIEARQALFEAQWRASGLSRKEFRKQQRESRQAAWTQQFKELRRAKRKNERQRKRARDKAFEEAGDHTAHLEDPAELQVRKRAKRERRPLKWDASRLTGHTVVFDCQYDDRMTPKEREALAWQLVSCYSYNRRSHLPMRMVVMAPPRQEVLRWMRDTFNVPGDGSRGLWIVEDPLEVYPRADDPSPLYDRSQLVYMTSDSHNVLERLSTDHVYVIGGIVDRNRHPGLTLERATVAGVSHARLPLDGHIGQRSHAMTVNHVFSMMLHNVANGGDWGAAFEDVVPARKK